MRIGELADYHVPTVEDVVSIGDEIMVVVTEIDRQGRVNLRARPRCSGTWRRLPPRSDRQLQRANRNGPPNRRAVSSSASPRGRFDISDRRLLGHAASPT